MLRNGGRILIDQLLLNGVDLAFGVPGESYLHALDAMYGQNAFKFVICRQEGGAAMMAEACGKLTGRPGIAFVTRGPGATNATAGLHIAMQDSTPMILFIGQVGRGMVEREAFQELDYRRFLSQVTKWTAEIDDPARIPEFVHRAFMTATSGRPGPVALALPEDMLAEEADVADGKPFVPVEAWPSPGDIEAVAEAIAGSGRPLLLLGGSGWDEKACADIASFADRFDMPTAVGFRRAHLMDNTHRCYMGDVGIGANPSLLRRLNEADLLIVLGSRLSEMTTDGYTRIGLPLPTQKMIHIHNGAEELGRVYQAERAILSGTRAMAAALAELTPPVSRPWAPTLEQGRRDYDSHTSAVVIPGDVQMGEIMAWLNQRLPADTIVTNGAGNYCTWPNRFYRYRSFGSQLGPTSGSMGYGLPAAVAAKLRCPERPVVCFAGDGCFMMHGQELATAMQYGVPFVTILVNNGMYGTIRMHQEREYPGRVQGTDLSNPDFVALARAYGGFGARVARTDEFAPAFEAAVASNLPAVIEVMIDPEAITPKLTISQIREGALKR
ncbi:MAG: thiamine pyrophosphate-binding protein [Geminicoccaceae bacterium]|nr:thiamine pyrophosphate-binding protein [Geminicoccaceae bacterium]